MPRLVYLTNVPKTVYSARGQAYNCRAVSTTGLHGKHSRWVTHAPNDSLVKSDVSHLPSECTVSTMWTHTSCGYAVYENKRQGMREAEVKKKKTCRIAIGSWVSRFYFYLSSVYQPWVKIWNLVCKITGRMSPFVLFCDLLLHITSFHILVF
jgi:hypothetical protein